MRRPGPSAVLAIVGVAAVGLGLLGRELIRDPHGDPRWTVIEKRSAHFVLIFQVETPDLGDALAIARELTEPVAWRYTEILIYFHRPGRPDLLPPRRVQWTPKGGYVETIYE